MTSKRKTFDEIVADTVSRFRYVPDETLHGTPEDWRIPQPDELGYLRGDCDDFALYVFDRGRAAGLNMRVVFCRIPVRGKGYSGHLVAYCDDLDLVSDVNHRHPFAPDYVSTWQWDSMSQVNQIDGAWHTARLTANDSG